MSTLAFFLEYAECPNKAQKNLPHPEAPVRGGGQQLVDGIADLASEEVAIHPKVALEVPDPWFNLCPSAEPLSGFAFLIGAGIFLWTDEVALVGFSDSRIKILDRRLML